MARSLLTLDEEKLLERFDQAILDVIDTLEWTQNLQLSERYFGKRSKTVLVDQ
jgi:hypothetical protein